MRSAALIFGLLAGLMGGVVIALGNIESGLALAAELGSRREFLAKFIVYVIPNVGLLGAGLTLARPRLGGLLLLLSAAAWAVAAILAGHGAVLFAALPFTFAAAGGLVALFASRSQEIGALPEDDAPPRLAHRWPDEPNPVEPRFAPRPQPAPRPPEYRSEPAFARRRPPEPPREEPPPVAYADEDYPADEYPAEEYPADEYPADDYPADDYPPEDYPAEDYIDAVESFDEEEPEPADEPLYDADLPLPEADDAAIEDIYGAAGVEPPAPPPRRQGRWSLPEAEEPPPASPPPAARYAAERQPLPQQRQPLPQQRQPLPGRRQPLPPLEDPPRRRWPPKPSAKARALPNRDRDADEFEPDDVADDLPPPRENPLRGFLQVLILGLFIVVVIGIAVAVYIDFGRGSQSLLFGSRPHATRAATATPPSVAAPPATPGGALVLEQPEGASAAQPLPPVPLADAGEVPRLPTSDTPPGAGPVAAGGVLFSDPFRYCEAVGTIDAPDAQYNGAAVPPVIATALGVPESTPGDEVHWRCANRAVLACASQGAACAPTPTVEVMLNYCAAHPDTRDIAAPNGSWSCNGARPVIPRDQKWPVDARGFYPGAWRQVAPGAAG